MDMFEQIARDLHEAQMRRYNKTRGHKRKNFFADPRGIEVGISHVIDDLQRASGTFKYNKTE